MLFMSSTTGGSPFSSESLITSIQTLPLLVPEAKSGSISNLWDRKVGFEYKHFRQKNLHSKIYRKITLFLVMS